jgi:Domain of unknown function (DUF4440)
MRSSAKAPRTLSHDDGDHVAVTPDYGAPQSVAEQIASLPELKYTQSIIGPAKVEVLGPDTGMRIFTAQLDVTFMGKPIPSHVFMTSIMARDDGMWRKRFYQVTAMRH